MKCIFITLEQRQNSLLNGGHAKQAFGPEVEKAWKKDGKKPVE